MDNYLRTYFADAVFTLLGLMAMTSPLLCYEVVRTIRAILKIQNSNPEWVFNYSFSEFAAFLSIWIIAVPFLAVQVKKCADNWGLDMLEISLLAQRSGCMLAMALLASLAMLRRKLEHRAEKSEGSATGGMLAGAGLALAAAIVIVVVLLETIFIGAEVAR